ncbi:hypothetical protein LUZ63_018932 [Rhynchospora breviuscula]|uniref:FCP1 homology domain-containing protein n=1 Tax=Rhynchospora breviuscula TaxID=2022672 RepID=A0A9Q0C584_9POAL|nr:hypothetical protein LUZ63_018932 [Rhynchospora breviuscula]
MVSKTPTKCATKLSPSPKSKPKSVRPHRLHRKRSFSPLNSLATAGSTAINASIRSCRRRLVKLFSHLVVKKQRAGFHRLKNPSSSPSPPAPLANRVAPTNLTLPPTVKKTLFLDLDETLVHSKTDPPPEKYDFIVHPIISGRVIPFYVLKRPGIDELLLAAAGASFEVVVFTAGLESYASQVLDQLDPTGAVIKHRLYRDSCREIEPGRFVKDLALTGRGLDQVVIVDDNPNAYTLQPDNAIPIKPFVDNLGDAELGKVAKFFELAGLFEDVRDAVRCYLSDFGDDFGTSV